MLPEHLAPLAVVLLAFCCAAGVVIALLYPVIARRSESQKRLAAIIVPHSVGGQLISSEDIRRKKAVEITLREQEEQQKAKKGTKLTLTGRLRQAGLGWSKSNYYALCGVSAVVVFLVALALFGLGPAPAAAFGLTGGLLLPHLYVAAVLSRRLRTFSEEFPNAVDIIVRGVRSGLPLTDCLRIISLESQEPVRGEFKVILEDQTMGVPMDQAVQRLPERIPLPEANFFAIVIAMQSRTGGSLSEALGNLSKVLRERRKMQGKIKAASSEAKASAAIIGSLPILVTFILYITKPDYISLLFTTFIGNLVLGVCAFWMLVGTLVMRKMINFDF
ncbi:type II secretion system F family protein [Microvirga arsenatis]|uniref:Pilus assembly protein n=1 Tax=Microvirga arsenatis TaxID=2692265 RepID=A0ABW9Z0C5_9HYPH|nr:type II secretion system F family protein [Microvirga arsenatis]NBJ10555.1 pilus assembly protein [Microvirga arsenatis]NBJ24546.1 pilus assembly protein [Microvirga arsenatis]